MDFTNSFVSHLTGEFRRRRSRNSAYSLRSFGRDLNVNSGRLSQYFSGKRRVTPKLAHRIMNRLALSPIEQSKWLGLNIEQKGFEPQKLDQEVFELISDPIHFDLLSLLETKDFRESPIWIANRLQSTIPEVNLALKRLKELGLTERIGKVLKPKYNQGVRTSDGLQSGAIRRSHRKQLEQAIDSLELVALDQRDISSISFAADLSRMPEAKKIIQDFRRKLSKLFDGSNKTEVYRLQIQLIPSTKIRGEKNDR